MKRPLPLAQQLVALLAATRRRRLRATSGSLVLWAAPGRRNTAGLFAILLTGTFS